MEKNRRPSIIAHPMKEFGAEVGQGFANVKFTFAYITPNKPKLGPHGMGYVTSGSKPRRAFWSIVLSIGFIGTVTVRDLNIFEKCWCLQNLESKVEDYNQFGIH